MVEYGRVGFLGHLTEEAAYTLVGSGHTIVHHGHIQCAVAEETIEQWPRIDLLTSLVPNQMPLAPEYEVSPKLSEVFYLSIISQFINVL